LNDNLFLKVPNLHNVRIRYAQKLIKSKILHLILVIFDKIPSPTWVCNDPLLCAYNTQQKYYQNRLLTENGHWCLHVDEINFCSMEGRLGSVLHSPCTELSKTNLASVLTQPFTDCAVNGPFGELFYYKQ